VAVAVMATVATTMAMIGDDDDDDDEDGADDGGGGDDGAITTKRPCSPTQCTFSMHRPGLRCMADGPE